MATKERNKTIIDNRKTLNVPQARWENSRQLPGLYLRHMISYNKFCAGGNVVVV